MYEYLVLIFQHCLNVLQEIKSRFCQIPNDVVFGLGQEVMQEREDPRP